MPGKRTANGRLKTVTIRVSEEEYEQLHHWARLSGLSLSDYLRSSKARPSLIVTSTGAASVTWRVGVSDA